MKTLLMLLSINFMFATYSQDLDPPAELFIENHSTTKSVYVKVIPVGFIFNGKYQSPYNYSIHEYKYSPEAARRLTSDRNFVYGGNKNLLKKSSNQGITFENRFYLSTDNSTHSQDIDSLIGIGK